METDGHRGKAKLFRKKKVPFPETQTDAKNIIFFCHTHGVFFWGGGCEVGDTDRVGNGYSIKEETIGGSIKCGILPASCTTQASTTSLFAPSSDRE